jgi:hypothetical protein
MHHVPHTLDALLNKDEALSRPQLEALEGYLQERLEAIGEQGDCAYERAMGIKYRELPAELRARLDRLPACA